MKIKSEAKRYEQKKRKTNMKVLFETAETIRFLRKEGYKIYLRLSEDFATDCRNGLSEFLPDKNA